MHSITSEEINKVAYGAFNSIAVASPNKFYVTRSTEPLEPYGKHVNEYFKIIYDSIMKPTGVHWVEYDPETKAVY